MKIFSKRPATQADIPFLLALRRQTMDEHLRAMKADTSDAYHHKSLMYHFDYAEVLLVEGRMMGLLKVKREASVWTVIQFQISQEYQGQGVGAAVMSDLLESAEAAGVSVKLGVLKSNPAKRLYERLGFVVVDEGVLEYEMCWPE